MGLIRVNQWGYDWGYSNAYMELMCIDTTIIHYPKIKDTEKTPTKEDYEETIRSWKEQKQKENDRSKTIQLKD